MARKSRKNIIENTAAAYLRLSVVKEKVPSDSIENQLAIIKDFISKHSDIEFTSCYIDIDAVVITLSAKISKGCYRTLNQNKSIASS